MNRSHGKMHPARRASLIAALKAHAEVEEQARLDKYVQVAEASAAGMTVREIAEVFGIGSGTATRWKAAGESEQERRSAAETGDGAA